MKTIILIMFLFFAFILNSQTIVNIQGNFNTSISVNTNNDYIINVNNYNANRLWFQIQPENCKIYSKLTINGSSNSEIWFTGIYSNQSHLVNDFVIYKIASITTTNIMILKDTNTNNWIVKECN